MYLYSDSQAKCALIVNKITPHMTFRKHTLFFKLMLFQRCSSYDWRKWSGELREQCRASLIEITFKIPVFFFKESVSIELTFRLLFYHLTWYIEGSL